MKYKLLGIDLDGTLLGPDHKLRPGTAEAIARARAAGLRVCLATGRSHSEAIDIWRKIDWTEPYEPIVLIGGAMVAEPDTGRTLYHRTIASELACEFADALGRAGYAAMAIIDPWRHGWEYSICETGDVHSALRDWLDKAGSDFRRVPDLALTPEPLRISVVVAPEAADELAESLQQQFDGRLNVHAIVAPNYNVTIVEGFAPKADKWVALKYVAQSYRIAPGQIVAVGDDVNDLPMIRGAGLGAVMPDARDELRAAADHVVENGLAEFIRQLSDGDF